MKSNMLKIKNRLGFLLKLFKSVSIYAFLAFVIFSLLIFQENQILGSAISICFIHFFRNDKLLIQIAYGESYKLIIFCEYLLLFLFYVAAAVFVNDPLILYSPLVFLIIIAFLYLFKATYPYNMRGIFIWISFIDKKDFIWRSGFRGTQIKFLLIYLFFLPLMLGTKNIYIYSFLLFSLFLVVFNFYSHKISQMYLDLISGNTKKSLLTLYKKNVLSLLKLMLVPTLLQIWLFYDNELIAYSISSLIICLLLIFQFLCVNIYTYRNNRSIAFMQFLNGFSIIAILIPPLGILLAGYSFKLFNKLN